MNRPFFFKIRLTSEIKDLFVSENQGNFIGGNAITVINRSDEIFLNQLVDYTEKDWHKANLKVADYCKNLGVSKSQLYRIMTRLIGKSLNTYLKEYRLNNALKLIKTKSGNISQIAFETGFNSPAYFSKCFQESFGILPSNYLKKIV